MKNQPHAERRTFLKQGGGIGLTLSLSSFAPGIGNAAAQALAKKPAPAYSGWEDIYRRMWTWDKVHWGSHTNACWPPGACSFYVYTRNGIVWREEQAAHSDASNRDHVDFNPLGCQKGAAFHNALYGEERLKYPLKRVGARGEGKWQRVSWDQAATEIADAILDSYQSQGSDGFILDAPHIHAGVVAYSGAFRLVHLLGGVYLDLTLDIGDLYAGINHTLGKQHHGYSADNLLDAELIIMTCSNWSYTYPSSYHFITEARYKGAEVVLVAPDVNPTSPAADIHVPVGVGLDTAFWLGVCQVIVSEELYDRAFVCEQTDLPLLVRMDNGHFLSEADVEGGRANQYYHYDTQGKRLHKAARGTLKLEIEPALHGTHSVRLKDGSEVRVQPVFERLGEHLKAYTPEKASALSHVPASLIVELGRKIAQKRTCNYIGYTSPKLYHGDTTERSLLLAMALTGNWGKPGTGFVNLCFPEDHVLYTAIGTKPVAEGGLQDLAALEKIFDEKVKKEDPDASDEIVHIEMMKGLSTMIGAAPPAFWLYNHCGYDRLYDNRAWSDPEFGKTFGERLKEGIDKGWWTPQQLRPARDKQPQVLMLLANNPLRRKRSGAKLYPEVLFPKLKMIFALETRMSSSAMYADIVLPCAWYYEKHDMTLSTVGNPFYAYIDRAVEPPGECKEEWAAMALIMKKIGERAKARGMSEYVDNTGQKRRLEDLWNAFTMNGHLQSNEDCMKEMTQVNVATGVFPEGYTYAQFRKDGQVRIQGLGVGMAKYSAANEFDPKKPFYPLRWHLDDKKIFPTQTRRAQFYLDHEWYLEAGEALPTFKAPPKIGGDHPFAITGGHPRVSIHSSHLANPHLARLHRGQPVVHVNDADAAELGLQDGDMAVLYNDFAECELMVRCAANVQPKELIVYMWEAYQHKGWMPYDALLIGIPKALLMAGGYDQFRFFLSNGSPPPTTDRGVRVSLRKA
ncbi:MAG: molybdopterin-dependent oxidoreductase [Rhodocyclaceae bacterium]|nr:molybdopterin-dependent oxidoreductase [Rhodocyclaceae bacterium]